jgi:hypothetical protein
MTLFRFANSWSDAPHCSRSARGAGLRGRRHRLPVLLGDACARRQCRRRRRQGQGLGRDAAELGGALPKHAEQFDALIAKKVDAIIIAMGKPVEADAQFKEAKDAKIPVITVQSGASPHALFDIQSNEYTVGADAALYLLGQLGYQGNIVTARFDLNVASRIRGKVLDNVLSENQA